MQPGQTVPSPIFLPSLNTAGAQCVVDPQRPNHQPKWPATQSVFGQTCQLPESMSAILILCSSCHTCEALSTPKGPKGPKGADHTDHTSIVHFCSGALRETTCSAKRVETKCSKCSECATAAWDPHPPMPVQRFNPQCLKEKTEWPDKKQISGKRKISWACLEVLAGVRVMHHLVIINR